MKPARSILDDSFVYVPAAATSVAETWRRFGWQPATDEERKWRRRRMAFWSSELVTERKPIRLLTAEVPRIRVLGGK